MCPRSGLSGFSLLELLVVLVLIGVLSSLAVPALSSYVQRQRLRGALDRLTVDIYHARVLAARSGERVHLRFEREADGCVVAYSLALPAHSRTLRTVSPREEAPGLCLTVSGSDTLRINSRGMPVGAARSIRARIGKQADSLRISIVGRVYRMYLVSAPALALHRVAEKFSRTATIAGRANGGNTVSCWYHSLSTLVWNFPWAGACNATNLAELALLASR